jgi:hypothetical protein
VRYRQNQEVADDRQGGKKQKRPTVSPSISQDPAWVRVDCSEQGLEPVVEPDHQCAGAQNLEISRYKSNPEFLAAPDEDDRRQKRDYVGTQSQKLCHINCRLRIADCGLFGLATLHTPQDAPVFSICNLKSAICN